MIDTLSSPELRRYAMRCRALADDPACSEEEGRRLMDMYFSFLSLAETANWLAGKPVRGGAARQPPQASSDESAQTVDEAGVVRREEGESLAG
jgi:hypothetical protein